MECPVEDCSYNTIYRRSLQLHLSTTHRSNKRHKCDTCAYSTNDKEVLARHCCLLKGLRVHCCSLCDFKTRRQSSLHQHIHKKHDQVKYKCNKCSFITGNLRMFGSHMAEHSGNALWECTVCYEGASTEECIKKHVQDKHQVYHGGFYKKNLLDSNPDSYGQSSSKYVKVEGSEVVEKKEINSLSPYTLNCNPSVDQDVETIVLEEVELVEDYNWAEVYENDPKQEVLEEMQVIHEDMNSNEEGQADDSDQVELDTHGNTALSSIQQNPIYKCAYCPYTNSKLMVVQVHLSNTHISEEEEIETSGNQSDRVTDGNHDDGRSNGSHGDIYTNHDHGYVAVTAKISTSGKQLSNAELVKQISETEVNKGNQTISGDHCYVNVMKSEAEQS